ncbi:hypothetical protein KBY58_05755 [Cyanobium sp. HWJ4-Hawea]|uniref:hypothetical protein n=1 Tax=unclassified Cyanobium TaxID=2627006 RepID=UPI0020CEE56C|nr:MULTISPECIES: hypothetical protein [unclassified Cyanobium]MCP9775853.1 hypothetical protein [Cyanobium sp. WAJ14-Wanaka]MCP9808932.1 hypothetical protein [Cyanobium sp. HWJ4-Hawea]
MKAALRLLLLPLRAPMLLVLVAIAVYEGLSWGHPPGINVDSLQWPSLFWSLDCLHAVVVVVICTMPDLLLQRVSSLMAASRVISLVITLLIVTIGGLYMLHLQVLSHVLILASGVLLARVDLARIRVVPPPALLTAALTLLVLLGATAGHFISSQDPGLTIG